jgi:uncharacterized protein YacL
MGEPQYRITIGDIDVPFGRLVAFFVKATLAAIPAAIIVWLIFVVLWAIVATIFGLAFVPRPAL